jgi:hypothetical protein
MSDLFENRNVHRRGGSYTSRKTRSTDQPATLENYAAYVGLPVAFLKSLGLKEYRHLGEPAVSMPYLDENGEVLLTRSRVSLMGRPKVKTRKGRQAPPLRAMEAPGDTRGRIRLDGRG